MISYQHNTVLLKVKILNIDSGGKSFVFLIDKDLMNITNTLEYIIASAELKKTQVFEVML